jgi:hypothetical protein
MAVEAPGADAELVRADFRQLREALVEGGVMGPEHAGNVVSVVRPEGAPDAGASENGAVVAFNLAELLRSRFPRVVVQSRLDLADTRATLSAANLAALARLVIALPAIAAILGATLVAGEARSSEFALMQALGYPPTVLRGAITREIAMIAAAAGAIGLALAAVIAAVAALPLTVGESIRTVIFGAGIPPLLAFLAARSYQRTPLGDQMRELDQ